MPTKSIAEKNINGKIIREITKLRLSEKDNQVLQEIYNYGGMSLRCISGRHFNQKIKYASRRLNQFLNAGLVGRYSYYAVNKTKKGKTFTQRVASIYYTTHKGINTAGLPRANSKYLIPKQETIDEINMLSNLLIKVPDLISRRQGRERYNLDNYSPISCMYPTTPPTAICIAGESSILNRLLAFIKVANVSLNLIIVSRNFSPKYILPNTSFIPWTSALEILPNILQDPNHYIKELATILKHRYPDIEIIKKSGLYAVAETSGRTLYLAELFTGSADLKKSLLTPKPSTIIYSPSRSMYGLKIQSGQISLYSANDRRYYTIRSAPMKPYEII